MSEVAVPKVAILIISEPAFFDDHFCKGWTLISGSRGFGEDGVTLTGNGAVARIERALLSFIQTTATPYLILNVERVEGSGTTWGVQGYRQGVGWVQLLTGRIDVGLVITQMPSGMTLTKLALIEEYVGTAENVVDVDMIAVSKSAPTVPSEGDIIGPLKTSQGEVREGVNFAEFELSNLNGEYNAIRRNDVGIIWLSRSTSDLWKHQTKAFGGRVMIRGKTASRYGDWRLKLTLHGHAEELNKPSAHANTTCTRRSHEYILNSTFLNILYYVTRHPENQMWFDYGGATGQTDDRLPTGQNFPIEFTKARPMDVLSDILNRASNASGKANWFVQERPSGVLVGHLKDSLDFTSPVSAVTPSAYALNEDMHPAYSAVRVYGKEIEDLYYLDPDAVTEQDAGESPQQDGWSSNGLCTWVLMSDPYRPVDPVVGNSCIKLAALGNTITATLHLNVETDLGPKGYRKLVFWVWVYHYTEAVTTNFTVFVRDTYGSYWYKSVTNQIKQADWSKIEITFDESWGAFSYPDWHCIRDLIFQFSISRETDSTVMFIDGLSLGRRRVTGTAQDTNSTFGRVIEEIVIDENVCSDLEAQQLADALIARNKDPPLTLEAVTIDGDLRYQAGDRQRVVIGHEGVDAYFPIAKVENLVDGPTWDSQLTLGKESLSEASTLRKLHKMFRSRIG